MEHVINKWLKSQCGRDMHNHIYIINILVGQQVNLYPIIIRHYDLTASLTTLSINGHEPRVDIHDHSVVLELCGDRTGNSSITCNYDMKI